MAGSQEGRDRPGTRERNSFGGLEVDHAMSMRWKREIIGKPCLKFFSLIFNVLR